MKRTSIITSWSCDCCNRTTTVDDTRRPFQATDYPPGWGRGAWIPAVQKYEDLCQSCAAVRRTGGERVVHSCLETR